MEQKRLRFAYITRNIIGAGGIGTDTPKTIWLSVLNECRRQNICLLTLIGTNTGAGMENYIYELLTKKNIDGILSWACSDEQDMKKILTRLPDVPIVTLSVKSGEVPCIRLDNISGMSELIEHLIVEHGAKKIAFVQGPLDHAYAKERLLAYRQTLERYKIAYNPELLSVPCEWNIETGQQAVHLFIQERKLALGRDIDAIVCANDRIAVGVIEGLRHMGYRCPQDILVTGYNNLEEAKNNNPSITSVSMPFQDQGAAGVIKLKEIVEDRSRNSDISLPTALAVHESCGCSNHMIISRSVKNIPPRSKSETLKILRETKKELISRAQNDFFLQAHAEREITTSYIFDCFISSIENGRLMPEYIRDVINSDTALVNSHAYRMVLSLFLSSIYEQTSDKEILLLAESISGMMIGMLTDLNERKEIRERMIYIAQAEKLQHMDRELTIQDDIQGLCTALLKHLSKLGIPSVYMVLFDDPTGKKKKNQMRMHFAYNRERILEIPPQGVLIPNGEIFPEAVGETYTKNDYVIRPLCFNKEKLGYIIFQLGPDDGYLYELITLKLNSAIKNVYMKRESFLQSEKIHKANTNLAQSFKMLQETQRHLIESEKMASLGGLVAGIAHEVNTPVGIGVTISSMLEEKINNFESHFKDNTLTVNEFENYLKNTKESIKIISANMQKAARLIQSFKQVAVDQSDEVIREFYIGKYIDDVLFSLHPLYRKTHIEVKNSYKQDILIMSNPGSLSQIISNLVINSMIHGFTETDCGEITIEIERNEGEVSIIYKDTGKGIEKENLKRIFDPFFTTKRGSGGSGLGLYITYNLVTQSLKGSITCESSLGNGVLFVISFPVKRITEKKNG